MIEVPGGAANAERCLSRWDVRTSLSGYAQNDCPIKTRYVEGNRILFRADDDGVKVRVNSYKWAHNLALEMAHCADGVLLSDYDKGFLTTDLISAIAEICHSRGIPCVADIKRPPSTYPSCILKCNSDYQQHHNQDLSTLVYDVDSPQKLVVTAGPLNPIIWGQGDKPLGLGYYLPPITCINHVGAGDCFAAHLTLALTYGFSLKESAALAHSAGRVYVQHLHNRPPLPTEVMADLSNKVAA